MKICIYCKIEKPLENFNKLRKSKDGHKSYCRACQKIEYDKNKDKNLANKKTYYETNKTEYLNKCKNYYKKNKESIKRRTNNYYYENKEIAKERQDEYRNENRDKINKQKREYHHRKRQEKLAAEQNYKNSLITVEYPPDYKICSKCSSLKRETEYNFVKNKKNRGDLRKATCRECCKLASKEYRINNSEKLLAQERQKYQENKDFYKEKKKKYRQSEVGQSWRKEYKSRLYVKIADRLRAQVKRAMKEYEMDKTAPTLDYLGCSLEFFVEYIKSLLKDGMTYQDLLNGEIHLDHIEPLCGFDLTKQEEINKAFHYTNYQPLFGPDNSRKATEDKKKSIHS